MKIQTIPTINFKSDYYGLKKTGSSCFLTSIKTDDEPLENKELLLRIRDYRGEIHGDFPMIYDGKYYTWNMDTYISPTSYQILNKKTETEEKELNEFDISKKINIYNRLITGKPAEKIFSKGSAEGLLVSDLNNIPEDKPVIVIIDKFEDDSAAYDTISVLPKNVYGIILNNALINDLSHAGARAKQDFDVVSIIYDDKKYNEIKKLAGEYITVSNESGETKYSKIEASEAVKIIENGSNICPPNIPILDEEEKLLDFSELTRKNSGEKAYRLGVMQKLLNEGYLSDIDIPKGFVVPAGYINKIYGYINETNDKSERREKLISHPLNSELVEMCKLYGIKEDDARIRSAFNAEDLPDYPTAGIYESKLSMLYGGFVKLIDDVVNSKDALPAKKSRERYGISDDIIQPTIIVQQDIYTKYPFTLYTETEDGKLRIETKANVMCFDHGTENAIISYDRKSGELKLETVPNSYGDYLVKDTGEVIERHLEQDEIEKDWGALIEPLKIAISNALKLEKYFGKPQDIEGGIFNGKVYFWQTRDIIKKAVK